MSWLVPRSKLTADQVRAIEMDANRHRLVVGSLRTGKTNVMLYRAQCLIEKYSVPLERYRIFVASNVQKEYLRPTLKDMGLPLSSVTTLDECYRKTSETMAKRQAGTGKPYDFILVDDAQDLNKYAYQLFAELAEHVTVFTAFIGASQEDALSTLGLNQRNMNRLNIAHFPMHLDVIAAAFIDDYFSRSYFLENIKKNETGERQLPLLYLARNLEDEINRLADVARERIFLNDRVAVLSTRLTSASRKNAFIDGMKEIGLIIDTVNDATEVDFNNERPKTVACEKAKSLTFDSVLMPGLVEGRHTLGFNLFDHEDKMEDLFVGVARAEKWVYFSALEHDCPFLDRFEELEQEGKLVIQRSKPDTPDIEPVETIQSGEETVEHLSDLF